MTSSLLQLMKVALTMKGVDVKVARDGHSALALAADRSDAALLEVLLPGTTGAECSLRSQERDPPTSPSC